MSSVTEFNKFEQEIIVLKAICDLIDNMVNYSMLVKKETFNNSNVLFSTSAHAQLFNIQLCDFLSLPQAKSGHPLPFNLSKSQFKRKSDRSYLFYLRNICSDPNLGSDTKSLLLAVENFSKWLEEDTLIQEAWFPSIELKLDLRVVRIDALKIAGNFAKHNFTRLEADVKKIKQIFKDNDHKLKIEECYQILSEFHEWFHNHAFNYQSSEIAELLNELRWAIHQYLEAEFKRAYKPYSNDSMNIGAYKYLLPNLITKPLIKAIYRDLMNTVRSKPIVPRFTVNTAFKTRLRK